MYSCNYTQLLLLHLHSSRRRRRRRRRRSGDDVSMERYSRVKLPEQVFQGQRGAIHVKCERSYYHHRDVYDHGLLSKDRAII